MRARWPGAVAAAAMASADPMRCSTCRAVSSAPATNVRPATSATVISGRTSRPTRSLAALMYCSRVSVVVRHGAVSAQARGPGTAPADGVPTGGMSFRPAIDPTQDHAPSAATAIPSRRCFAMTISSPRYCWDRRVLVRPGTETPLRIFSVSASIRDGQVTPGTGTGTGGVRRCPTFLMPVGVAPGSKHRTRARRSRDDRSRAASQTVGAGRAGRLSPRGHRLWLALRHPAGPGVPLEGRGLRRSVHRAATGGRASRRGAAARPGRRRESRIPHPRARGSGPVRRLSGGRRRCLPGVLRHDRAAVVHTGARPAHLPPE